MTQNKDPDELSWQTWIALIAIGVWLGSFACIKLKWECSLVSQSGACVQLEVKEKYR